MITYQAENQYIDAEISIETERIQALENLDAYGWITPQEWMESYGNLQQVGMARASRFLERNKLKLNSADPSDLGKCFVGGAYGNNLHNWRTVDAVDCALRDRVRLCHIGGQHLEEDEIIPWLVAHLNCLVAHRIPDVNNRRFMLGQLEKWSSDNLRNSSITIETVDSLPPLLPFYCATIQMSFKQKFGGSAEIDATNTTLNHFMMGVGINEHTSGMQAVAAIDDFNHAILPAIHRNLKVYEDLMAMAFAHILTRHHNFNHEKIENSRRNLRSNDRPVDTQQIMQSLISDARGIEVYKVAAEHLSNAKESFWAVSRREPYSLGQTPRMPEKHI